MKKTVLITAFLLLGLSAFSQQIYFPPTDSDNWESISPESLGWCPGDIPSFYQFLEEKNTKAFLLLKNGKFVLEQYFGNFQQDSLWYWASAGKSLTSFLTGLALQENMLDLEDPTSLFLGQGWTNCSASNENLITIKDQLSMTTGLDDAVDDNHCTRDTCLNCFTEAGSRWAYHNAPYTLLIKVLEAASGMPINLFTHQKLKSLCGMDGAFFNLGYDMLYLSTARSMARFGILIQAEGEWDGHTILYNQEYFQQMVNTSQPYNKSYGYLWWLNGKESFMMPGLQYTFEGSICPNAPGDMFAALGKNGQFLNIVPSNGLVMVRMGDAPGEGDVPVVFCDSIWTYINNIICAPSDILNNPNHKQEVHVTYSPGSKKIIVSWHQKEFTARLYNSTGRLITGSKNFFSEGTIQANNCKTGIYLLEITDESDWKTTRKIMIQ